MSARERDRKLNRALSLSSVSVATGSILLGGVLFFCLPRFNAGYLGRASFNPSLMSGFTENVELGQIGEIKKNSTVVMRVQTGKPIAYDGCAGEASRLRRSTANGGALRIKPRKKLEPEADGWIRTADSPRKTDSPYPRMIYTVYLEPVATDAIFVPGKVMSLKGNFSGESRNSFSAARRAFIFRDSTDTLLNPFHNYGAIRYSGFSLLPRWTRRNSAPRRQNIPAISLRPTFSFLLRWTRGSPNLPGKPRKTPGLHSTKPWRLKLSCALVTPTR